ncbi:MAG: YihY family inner membrane protein [Pseudomonadales bacterium]
MTSQKKPPAEPATAASDRPALPPAENAADTAAETETDITGIVRVWWTRGRWYLGQMVQQFLDHDCPARAGALTYTTLFAVVPMMTVAYAMFSIMPAYDGIGEQIETYVFQNFVPELSSVVQEKLGEFSERARSLTAAGFAFLFVTTFLLLVTIEKTFNIIWNVAEPRRGLQRILVYWGVLSLGPPMIAGAILISVYLASLPLISGLDVFGLGGMALSYLPMLLVWTGFTILYFAVPNCHVPFPHALIGGFLTMWSFELAKVVFNVIVARSNMASIYGAFAAVPFFLAWMYMAWVLILAGAIFVRTLSLVPELKEAWGEPVLVKCARILKLLHEAHLQGGGVSEAEVADQVQLTRNEFERVMEALTELRLLRHSEDQWVLGRSLRALTLWDLYRALPEGLDRASLARIKDMEPLIGPLRSLVDFGSNQMTVSLEDVLGRQMTGR